MRHLVLGGTGTVGSLVVSGLIEKGESVRVVTRDAAKAKALPQGATAVVGDMARPETYDGIFRDYDTLFLLTANGPSDLLEGLGAVAEARRTKAKRVVHLSIQDLEKGLDAPHFASKIAVEAALAQSGLAWTILRPNNFFQNDWWWKDVIVQHGVYPQPIGSIGLSRVDTRDIAEAAVRALTEPGHTGKKYTLAGPDALTGEETAKAFADALGRKVVYGGDDLDAWAKAMAPYLAPWAIFDYRLMYAMFQAKGLKATPAQLEETRAILGHAPRRFADFVKEFAAAAR